MLCAGNRRCLRQPGNWSSAYASYRSDGIQRYVLHPVLLPVIRHGCPDSELWPVLFAEILKTFRSQVFLGLYLYRYDSVLAVKQVVDLKVELSLE